MPAGNAPTPVLCAGRYAPNGLRDRFAGEQIHNHNYECQFLHSISLSFPVNFCAINSYLSIFGTVMRFMSITLCLVLAGLSGCSQNEHHNFHKPNKIPIEPSRWYILNNTGINPGELFDTILNQKSAPANGKILENYEAWYQLLPGEEMEIDSLAMYDYATSSEQRPTRLYAITTDWKRVPLADFIASGSGTWVGPSPAEKENKALKSPVTHIRYLVINTWGNIPSEIELLGKYTPPTPIQARVQRHFPLKNFFGINGFEWNFEDPKSSDKLDAGRLNAVRSFSGVRHYLDWEKIENKEGSFSFNPARNGGWNYDTMYRWCFENGMDLLVCLKDCPPWMLETYPENQRNNENIPVRFGKDPSDPASYTEMAKAAFQFAARYGRNKDFSVLPTGTVHIDATPRWNNDIVNTVRTGLGWVTYMECSNEPDKWWKGRKSYQSGREYAANLSAFYDGHKKTLGAAVGVKNADPTMQVVMAGVAIANSDYLKGIIDWAVEFRGRKPDGSPDLPFDVINYHYYSDEYAPGKKPADAPRETGVSPELSRTAQIADDFLTAAHLFAGDRPVWVTETGYDLNQGSPVKALPCGKKNAAETAADWDLRAALLYARLGIAKTFFYEFMDDNGTSTRYGTCGLINNDKTRRPAADYMYQVNRYFGEYSYVSTITTDPVVDQYAFHNNPVYVLYITSQSGKTAVYDLKIPASDTVYIYSPRVGAETMTMEKVHVSNGTAKITLTETPVFVASAPIEPAKK